MGCARTDKPEVRLVPRNWGNETGITTVKLWKYQGIGARSSSVSDNEYGQTISQLQVIGLASSLFSVVIISTLYR
jgi:hypothetical protein